MASVHRTGVANICHIWDFALHPPPVVLFKGQTAAPQHLAHWLTTALASFSSAGVRLGRTVPCGHYGSKVKYYLPYYGVLVLVVLVQLVEKCPFIIDNALSNVNLFPKQFQ